MTEPRSSGSSEGVAILVSVDPDTNDASWDVFRESDDDETDPITRAEQLMAACRDDFSPTRLWTFTGNDRARDLRSKHLMARLLGEQ